MKVGIITHIYGNDNYGGTLQAYAMQSILEQLGHNAFFCNCAVTRRKNRFSRFLEHPLREILRARRYRRFVPFWHQYIHHDPNGHRDLLTMLNKPTKADVYLCGSDQIWGAGHLENKIFRRFAFADFGSIHTRRIAYAPSFSSATIMRQKGKVLCNLLSRFSALSAREQTGVDIIRQLGFKAELVLDPTLLHKVSFWERLLCDTQVPENLLFFPKYRWKTICPTKQAVNAIKNEGDYCLRVPSNETVFEFPKANVILSPEEWLTYIAYSKFVLTNSFHGMVFAIIFHKPFAVLKLDTKYDGMNTRFYSLLEKLNLLYRIAESPEDVTAISRSIIDWEAVELKLSELRQHSLSYLTNALSSISENNIQ